MAKTRTTFGYASDGQPGESSGTQPITPSLPPDMNQESKDIERRLEEMRQQMMKEALDKKLEALQRRQAEEAERLRLENEQREREEKEAEDERLRLQEEERARGLEEFNREMLQQAEENERLRQKELRDKAKETKRRAVMRKKEAEKKQKERRSAADSDYDPISEDDDEVETSRVDENPTVKKASQKKQGKQAAMTTLELTAAFAKYGFTGTAYPDLATTQKLGIRDDYASLIRGCGLAQYATMAEPTYPEAAAQFLATVTYSELKSEAFLESMGGGYITFTINKKEYTRTLKEIQVLFGFPTGKPTAMEVTKEEQLSIWKLLSGGEKFESGVKGGIRIRSPTVAYARQVIAETFYSRTKTGPIATGDLNILIRGLREVFKTNPISGEPIVGDTAGAGLAYVLAKHLESYRGKLSASLKKGSDVTPNTIGGPITCIMKDAGVVGIDWDSEHTQHLPPRVMNLDYLRSKSLLTGPLHSSQFFYKFQYQGQEVVIELPNEEATTFADATNVQFIPSEELLVDTSTLATSLTSPSSERATAAASTKKRRTISATKGKAVTTAPCLTTAQLEELKEKLRPEIIAELTPVLIEQLTPVLTAQLTPIITAQIEEHIGRKLKRKRTEQSNTFKLPASPTGAQQRPSTTSSVAPPKHPSTGSSSTLRSETRPQKLHQHHSPTSGDASPSPPPLQRKKPNTVRLNVSTPRNPST